MLRTENNTDSWNCMMSSRSHSREGCLRKPLLVEIVRRKMVGWRNCLICYCSRSQASLSALRKGIFTQPIAASHLIVDLKYFELAMIWKWEDIAWAIKVETWSITTFPTQSESCEKASPDFSCMATIMNNQKLFFGQMFLVFRSSILCLSFLLGRALGIANRWTVYLKCFQLALIDW